jgi:hypothetical protein
MTDWKEQTADELLSQMETEVRRVCDSKKRLTLPPLIISKDLYDRIKEEQ